MILFLDSASTLHRNLGLYQHKSSEQIGILIESSHTLNSAIVAERSYYFGQRHLSCTARKIWHVE